MTVVNAQVRQKLIQINKDFYDQFASAFAATRHGEQPGWKRIIPYFPAHCQVLDLGCGHGRFAHFLDQYLQQVDYVGLDGSEELIALAEKRSGDLSCTTASFRAIELDQPDWQLDLEAYDVVVALAVMHHIPGFAARAAFLRHAARHLAAHGVIILSNWRFTHNDRMRRKIVPWDMVGLSEDDLEPGDFLLDWKKDGTGYRYAHQVDEGEMAELAQVARLQIIEQFHADGREGDLSLYTVLR